MKKETDHQDRIALIAENEELLEDVAPLLKQEFSCIEELMINENTVEQIESFQPEILVFSCNDVSAAETFYLTLLRTSQKFLGNLHESIILCKREEVQKCYNLCKNEIFNDFVLFRPIYEPYRLLLTVFQAIERRNSRLFKGGQRKNYGKIGNQMAEVEHDLELAINSCQNSVGDIDQAELRLIESLGRKIDEFRERLATAAPQHGIAIINQGKMDQAFDQFKQREVKAELASSNQAIRERLSQAVANISKQKTQLAQVSSELKEVSGLNHRRILLIEDDQMFVEMTKAMLTAESYLVETASNGVEGLAKLANYDMDLILTDITMPQMSGLEFLKRVKASNTWQDIPVIMTTGDSTKASVVEALRMGAIDYIVKPFDRVKFLKRIREILSK